MKNHLILSETVSFREEDGGGNRVKATLARGDMVNRNYRFYPTEVLEKACNSVQDDVKSGKLIGLSGHPGWFDSAKGEPGDTVIKWDKLWMDGDDLMGEGVILDTAKGRDVLAMKEAGVHIALSTNGYAASTWVEAKELPVSTGLRDDELVARIDVFELLTIDVVNDPANVFAQIHAEAVAARESFMKENGMDFEKKFKEVEKELLTTREAVSEKDALINSLQTELSELRESTRVNELRSMVREVAAEHGSVPSEVLNVGFMIAEQSESIETARVAVEKLFKSVPNHGSSGIPRADEGQDRALEAIKDVIKGVVK